MFGYDPGSLLLIASFALALAAIAFGAPSLSAPRRRLGGSRERWLAMGGVLLGLSTALAIGLLLISFRLD